MRLKLNIRRDQAKKAGRAEARSLTGLVATGSNSRTSAWSLNAQHQLRGPLDPEALPPGDYVSFTKDDLSATAERSTSLTLADIRADVGESVFHLRMEHGRRKNEPDWMRHLLGPTVYATPQTRLAEFGQGVRLIPGMALMRELMRNYPELVDKQSPFVTGLLFPAQSAAEPHEQGSEDGASETEAQSVQVLILMACNDEGQLEGMEYIPLAGVDIHVALSAFVQSRHMSASGEWPAERTVIFSGEEIAPALARLSAYPQEPNVLGVSLSRIYQVGAITLSVAAITALAASAGLSLLTKQQRAALTSARTQVQQIQQQHRDELVINRIGAYLQTKHVEPARALALAQALWLPNAAISIAATPDQVEITAIYQGDPLASDDNGGPQRSLLGALTLKVPQGCERVGMATSNTVQLIEVKYQCQI